MHVTLKFLVIYLLTITILSACGGGGTDSSASTRVAQFIDDPVSGLSYSCTDGDQVQTISGTTDTDGYFKYLLGQACTFKVGNFILGTLSEVPLDSKVTPQDIAGVSRSATAIPSALAIAQFLQSLNDGATDGKIVISAATTAALSANTATTTLATSSGVISQADLQKIVAIAGKALVSATDAQNALDTQISAGNVNIKLGFVSPDAQAVLNSIAVMSEKPSNSAGLTTTLTAIGYYSDGTIKNITNNVTWLSSNTSLVSINSSGIAQGLKKGVATITASSLSGGSTAAVKGSTVQTVTDPILQYINVSGTASLPAGWTDQLTAVGIYSDSTTIDLTKLVTWSSSDTSIVIVDKNGLATGLAKGNAKVTARFLPSIDSDAISGEFDELVTDPTLVNISAYYISSAINSILNATSIAIKAIASYSDSTFEIISGNAKWIVISVSEGANAVINVDKIANTATLTGTSPGIISIIASYLGLNSNSLNLTIYASPPDVRNETINLNILGTSTSTITGTILANDPQGHSLNYLIQTDGKVGKALIDIHTGYFTYTISGHVTDKTDSFNVLVTNGQSASVATVTVNLYSDPLLQNQWHLQNLGYTAFSSVLPLAGHDMNVAAAWAAGYTGKGIKVAVIDTGLELSLIHI
jgi:hypothetical protein